MKESSTYQYVINEGRLEEARKILLRQGRQRFGPASDDTRAAVEAINDLERLERMTDRVLTAASWQELLDTP